MRDTIRSDNLEECEGPLCLDVGDVPLLKNYRRELVDPDTPEDAMWKESADGKKYKLVVGFPRASELRVGFDARVVFG